MLALRAARGSDPSASLRPLTLCPPFLAGKAGLHGQPCFDFRKGSGLVWRGCMVDDRNEAPPPKVAPRLKAAPKIRQLYWCDFPRDAQLPEFWKRRPVIILSKTATLYGAVTVVPCSTQPQPDPRIAFRLRSQPFGRETWAICDKITTVAVSRLSASPVVPRLPADEFHELLALVLGLLPALPGSEG